VAVVWRVENLTWMGWDGFVCMGSWVVVGWAGGRVFTELGIWDGMGWDGLGWAGLGWAGLSYKCIVCCNLFYTVKSSIVNASILRLKSSDVELSGLGLWVMLCCGA
jgi:hypothetical protein